MASQVELYLTATDDCGIDPNKDLLPTLLACAERLVRKRAVELIAKVEHDRFLSPSKYIPQDEGHVYILEGQETASPFPASLPTGHA